MICRVCRRAVSASEEMRTARRCVFGGGGTHLMLYCLGLRLEEEPVLCLVCCSKLLDFFRFKSRAVESDAYFRACEIVPELEVAESTKDDCASGEDKGGISEQDAQQECSIVKQEPDSENTSDSDRIYSEFAVNLVNSEPIEIEDDPEEIRKNIRTELEDRKLKAQLCADKPNTRRIRRTWVASKQLESVESEESSDDKARPSNEESDPDFDYRDTSCLKTDKLWYHHHPAKRWKRKVDCEDWLTPLTNVPPPQDKSPRPEPPVGVTVTVSLPANSRKVTCDQCPNTFWTWRGRLKHSRRWHPRLALQHCDICHKGVNKLQSHNLLVHNKDALRFQCDDCGKKFITKNTLESHVHVVHMKGAIVACGTCKKTFASKQSLDSHVRSVHERIRPHCCPYCSKGFSVRRGLVRHVRIHTNERPFACNECDKRFNTSTGLKCHLKRHLGIKDYICETCGKGFPGSGPLKVHMMKHSSVRNFACQHCGVKFKRRDNMDTHIKNKHGANNKDEAKNKDGAENKHGANNEHEAKNKDGAENKHGANNKHEAKNKNGAKKKHGAKK